MRFKVAQKSVTLTLNDLMAIISCYFIENRSFAANWVKFNSTYHSKINKM